MNCSQEIVRVSTKNFTSLSDTLPPDLINKLMGHAGVTLRRSLELDTAKRIFEKTQA